jgi:hypothetical protein
VPVTGSDLRVTATSEGEYLALRVPKHRDGPIRIGESAISLKRSVMGYGSGDRLSDLDHTGDLHTGKFAKEDAHKVVVIGRAMVSTQHV